jgi:hypothetical protein
MLAGALLLAVVWVFLLRYVPSGPLITRGPSTPSRYDLVRAFAPKAAAALMFASRQDSRLREARQHKEDLATWEGEGGAPAE